MAKKEDIVSVIIVDDDVNVRDNYLHIVDSLHGMVCIGCYESFDQLMLDDIAEPTILLLDIGLPGTSGVDAIPLVRNDLRWVNVSIVMLTHSASRDNVLNAINAGATGYLHKGSETPAELVERLKELASGGAPMTPDVAQMVIGFLRTGNQRVEPESELSEREVEVISRIAEGKTNRQIADELSIAVDTVAYHTKNIYKKLHVHNRVQAASRYSNIKPRSSGR